MSQGYVPTHRGSNHGHGLSRTAIIMIGLVSLSLIVAMTIIFLRNDEGSNAAFKGQGVASSGGTLQEGGMTPTQAMFDKALTSGNKVGVSSMSSDERTLLAEVVTELKEGNAAVGLSSVGIGKVIDANKVVDHSGQDPLLYWVILYSTPGNPDSGYLRVIAKQVYVLNGRADANWSEPVEHIDPSGAYGQILPTDCQFLNQ